MIIRFLTKLKQGKYDLPYMVACLWGAVMHIMFLQTMVEPVIHLPYHFLVFMGVTRLSGRPILSCKSLGAQSHLKAQSILVGIS